MQRILRHNSTLQKKMCSGPKYAQFEIGNCMQANLKVRVGERIAQLRVAQKLSQQKFSYEADMERTYLAHIEKGRKNISISTLEKITGALGISIKEFFDTKEFS
jgi:DNA-binding XRE family transcriptional regulator